jgi:hypothetical protein
VPRCLDLEQTSEPARRHRSEVRAKAERLTPECRQYSCRSARFGCDFRHHRRRNLDLDISFGAWLGIAAKQIGMGEGRMRRRLERFIPIVLFAVMVQLIAPIGAFRAVAHVVSDPLAMATICTGMAAGPDGQTTPSHAPVTGADCCAFCPTAHGGAALIEPPAPAFVLLQRQYQRVIWLEATEAISVLRVGSNAKARAPPMFS